MFNKHYSIQKKCEIIKKLNNSSISKIVDICFDNDKIYVIQECVKGQALEEYVKKNKFLQRDDIYSVVLGLCDIINYLKNLNRIITYKNLSPSNIIITSNKKIVLSNFGTSEISESIDNKYTVYTIQNNYISEEDYNLKRDSEKIDIYNIGRIMYFMATGKLPSIDLEPLIDDNYPNHVDYNVKNIIQKCFQINAKDRYVSVEELKKEIIIDLLKKNKYTRSTISSSFDINLGISKVDIKREKKNKIELKTALMGGAALAVGILSALYTLMTGSKIL